MSSAKGALKNVNSTAAPAKGPNGISKQQLFRTQFVPAPKPLNNPVNYSITQSIAADPSHPFYIRTKRRIAAFDPNKLHWTVKAPVDLSKKAIVRSWAKRRVKEAFRLELERSGWTEEGRAIDGRQDLKGALCVYLNKDAAIVKANWGDVRKECGLLVQEIVRLQHKRGLRPQREKYVARNGLGKQGSVAADEIKTAFKSLDVGLPLFSPTQPLEGT